MIAARACAVPGRFDDQHFGELARGELEQIINIYRMAHTCICDHACPLSLVQRKGPVRDGSMSLAPVSPADHRLVDLCCVAVGVKRRQIK